MASAKGVFYIGSVIKFSHFMVLLLGLSVAGSAMAVIYVKHTTRQLFADLQVLQKSRDDMAIEWDQLQLEQGAYATHSRIESKARTQLEMTLPPPQAVVVIQR